MGEGVQNPEKFSDVLYGWSHRQKLDLGEIEEFVTSGLNNVMGMAVDWVGRNLYWTDEGMQAIYVAGLADGAKKKLLLHENMTHPRSVIVDPGTEL